MKTFSLATSVISIDSSIASIQQPSCFTLLTSWYPTSDANNSGLLYDMFDKEIFSKSLYTSAFVFSSSTASVHLFHQESMPWSFMSLPWFLRLICRYIKNVEWSFFHWMLCCWTMKCNIYVQRTRFNLVNETTRNYSHKTFW